MVFSASIFDDIETRLNYCAMKYLFTLTFVFSSFLGYNQKDNLSYPFQVLYAEDATYFGSREHVVDFDFINRYSHISNNGKLVLIHYTGYLFECNDCLIDVQEISEILHKEGEYVRPPISQRFEQPLDQWKSESHNHKIKLMYPWKHIIQLSKHDRLPLQWYYDGDRSLPRDIVYEITLKDIHDEILLQETTKENNFEIDLKNFHIPENILLCHISLPGTNETSDNIVIAFEQEHQSKSVFPQHYSVTKYQAFVDGLIALQKKETYLATKLFHAAIDTHESPLFKSMYEKLLSSDPKLKLHLE